MANELPTLDSTNKELESIYKVHSKRFFHWLETNSISPNSSRDIALLAHNELVKRSNNRYSRISTILTYSVVALSFITLNFALLDYFGDKEWQKAQITELELIKKNLTERYVELESLKLQLDKTKEQILILEQGTVQGE